MWRLLSNVSNLHRFNRGRVGEVLWRKRLVEGLLGLLWELGFECGLSKRLRRSGRVRRECSESGGICRNGGKHGCVR